MSEDTITLSVFRYGGEEGNEPTFQDYDIPYRQEWVVLDALNYIKDYVDGTLSYRWSCRMGVCGSCGTMVERAKAG
jgi:fumarate reductase iron-sulfur subunit